MKPVSKKLGNARLMKLVERLREVPRKQFDYLTWVGDDWKGKPDLSCGTKACALGWAATIPSLQRAGLHHVASRDGDGRIWDAYVEFRPKGTSKYDRKTDFGAASAVFGITFDEAYELFMPRDNEKNATPKQVAKKIERFVKSRS
jgi:hypothetical protein